MSKRVLHDMILRSWKW